MEDCIFCKIIKGEIPCKKVFESEKILAFLDVNPFVPGHILVIPKEHYKDIFTTPDNILEEINTTCKKMALLVKDKLNTTSVNILNSSGKDAQQSVFHIHYHVIPRHQGDKLHISFMNKEDSKTSIDEVFSKLVKK
jgi:histidine triad (HIT) family protein